MQNALDALATIGGLGGSVTVLSNTTTIHGVAATVYTVTLWRHSGGVQPASHQYRRGGRPRQPTSTRVVTAGSITPETQTIGLTGAAANTTKFTVTFEGATTAPITYTGTAADAAAIQAALDGLSTLTSVGGSVVVFQSGSSGLFTVEFGGSLAGDSLPSLSSFPSPAVRVPPQSRA